MRTTSRTAAPLGEVIRPMRLGSSGSGFLRAAIEQAFGFEAFLQLLKGQLQRAASDGLEILDVNLIFAARFVNADRAAHGHLQAVFGTELDAALLLLEENAADLRAIVFQSEVEVAGLRFAAVGDFAFDRECR